MKEFWPEAIIHSFEPVPDNSNELQDPVKRNSDLHSYPYALQWGIKFLGSRVYK